MRVLGAVAATLAVAGLAWWAARVRQPQLPSRITIEETVSDLSAAFDHRLVTRETLEDPVVRGRLRPGAPLAVNADYRHAIVAPPPSTIRFRVHVPAGAHLQLGTGVEHTARRGAHAAAVRFAVVGDGREIFSRVIDAAQHRHDRHWFDDDVDLHTDTERDVDVELRTTAIGGPGPVGGTPGWSQLRIVRRETRARQPADPRRPNVLVLLVDTLRADRLGCYGARPSPSPTLDGLAASGRLFEQAISQAPWTMPAVATFLTGLYPQSHGIVAGQEDANADGHGDPSFLPETIPTLALAAEMAGITTVGVSASPLVSRDTNLARGFETFVEFGWRPRSVPQWASATEVNAAFLEWLAHNRDRRFLAYLHYMDVHDPYSPPSELRPPAPAGVRRAIAAGDIHELAMRINANGAPPLDDAELDYLRALYDADIAAWDAALARLLDALAARGLRDSTILVILADHGEEFQDHGKLKHGIHLYDELIHVPLVIAGSGITPGRTATQVQGIDLFPTIATLLGVSAPAGLPGQDILAEPAERPAFSETRYGIAPDGSSGRLRSIRTAAWKLIEATASGQAELFDLAHDPGERQDRFREGAEGPALARELAHFEATAPLPPAAVAADPNLHEKLRALGYVE